MFGTKNGVCARLMNGLRRLDELNYAHETRELGPGRIELSIQKRPG